MATPGETVAEQNQGISCAPRSSLAEVDTHGKGHIDATDVRIFIHKMRLMRKAVVFLSIFSVVLVIGMFGSSFMAIQMAKDSHVQKGQLVDNSGRNVATLQQVDSIQGISETRRLSDSKGSTAGTMAITQSYFEGTRSGYLQGQTQWVASLPDGTKQNIQIVGVNGNFGWGVSGAWPYMYEWTSSCPEDMTECTISYTPVETDPGSNRLLTSRASNDADEEVEDVRRFLSVNQFLKEHNVRKQRGMYGHNYHGQFDRR